MRRITKRFISVMAAAAMVFGLAACGSDNKNEDSTASKNSSENQTAAGSNASESITFDQSEFENAVVTIDNIEIPEGTRIVALGEATHGNKEFQHLKLELFKILVEKTNVRALILEGDVGGCEIANVYIQGGEGTPEEVTRHLGYGIYRTDEMCELIKWMHDHNQTAAEEDKVRLYGMDMQYDEDSIASINSFYGKVAPDKQSKFSSKMAEYLGDSYDAYDASKYDDINALMDEIQADLDSNKEAYAEKTSAAEVEIIRNIAENIKYFISYCVKENETNKARDTYMKKNVDWILEVEEREHNGAVMIGCHNGHMTENQSSMNTFLGVYLNEEYGDSYYTIGTDFYNTKVNLPKEDYSGRFDLDLCSDDPLALAVKDMPENKYFIDFGKIDENTDLGKAVNGKMPTGSVGEYYTAGFENMKPYYQLTFAPTEMYDAMILFYEVNPIVVWDK